MMTDFRSNPWKGVTPFPSPEEAGDPSWDDNKLHWFKNSPKSDPDIAIERIISVICGGLVEDGFDAVASLYGQLSVITIEYSTYKFNLTVKDDIVTVVVANTCNVFQRRDDYWQSMLFEDTLNNPDVFSKLEQSIKEYTPSITDGVNASKMLDNRHTGPVIGGYGHAFDT
jgi:hypothetical protein